MGRGEKGINSSRSCNSCFLFFKQCASPWDSIELYFRKGLAYSAVSVLKRLNVLAGSVSALICPITVFGPPGGEGTHVS